MLKYRIWMDIAHQIDESSSPEFICNCLKGRLYHRSGYSWNGWLASPRKVSESVIQEMISDLSVFVGKDPDYFKHHSGALIWDALEDSTSVYEPSDFYPTGRTIEYANGTRVLICLLLARLEKEKYGKKVLSV